MGCAASKNTVNHNAYQNPNGAYPIQSAEQRLGIRRYNDNKKGSSSSSSSSSSETNSIKSSNKHKNNDQNQIPDAGNSNLLTRNTYSLKTYQHETAPHIEITVESIKRYIQLEKQIRRFENRRVTSQHASCKEELDAVCRHVDQLNSTPPQTGEDYDTALENHNRMLMSLHAQKIHLEKKISSLVTDLQQLQLAIDQRDDLLEALFGGCYGSSLEDQLEEEYIRASNNLGHIRAFYQHWKAAIVYTQKAFEQISTGYQFWQASYPNNYGNHAQAIAQGVIVPEQISQVTNARSWFVACSTNLGTAVRICLETLKVQIPYCQPVELETLNKAIHHIFIDAKTNERHIHAGKVYYSMGTRCGGLHKWLESVLENNIRVDMENADNYHKKCRDALSNERHRLIRNAVEKQLGDAALVEFDNDMAADAGEKNEDADQDISQNSPGEKTGEGFSDTESTGFAQITDPTNTNDDEKPRPSIKKEGTDDSNLKIQAISVDQLAPAPTRAQIYGHMFALMEEQEEADAELQKIEDRAKQKNSDRIQEKLAARRRRKLE